MPQATFPLSCLGCGGEVETSLVSFSHKSGPRCPDCYRDANLEIQSLNQGVPQQSMLHLPAEALWAGWSYVLPVATRGSDLKGRTKQVTDKTISRTLQFVRLLYGGGRAVGGAGR